MALFRALESSLPESTRLFYDPLARVFLTWPLSAVARLAAVPGLRQALPWIIDQRVPGARSSAVARTRLIDDAITACLREHTEQIVILGAGFDSRAYRLPGLLGIGVFEVDHPDTLAIKRRVLERFSVVPSNVHFVPTDFNQSDLASAMTSAGYRESARTFFLWEGVTNYLTDAAVDATLRWCSRASPGSQVLFGIDPTGLSRFLVDRGLSLEADLGASEYRERYFGEAAREMRGYEFYRIAIARVGS